MLHLSLTIFAKHAKLIIHLGIKNDITKSEQVALIGIFIGISGVMIGIKIMMDKGKKTTPKRYSTKRYQKKKIKV